MNLDSKRQMHAGVGRPHARAGAMCSRSVSISSLIAGLVLAIWLLAALGTPAASAAPPLVTCTSDPNVFNTGYNGAGGILPNEATDAHWEVAGPFFAGGTTPATKTELPPGSPSWGAARVGNQAPGAWSPSPFGNAQWISQQKFGENQGPQGDWYYRYQFSLDPSVNPSKFALQMNFLSDNDVAEVFVNGVAQSPLTTGLPQNTSNPYFFVGYKEENAAKTTLNHSWQTGPNEVIVQIKSGVPKEGFLAQIRPSAVCPVNLHVTKSETPDPYVPGKPLTYTVKVTNSGPGSVEGVTVSDPLPAALTTGGFKWTCAPSAGSSCTPSGSGGINDTKAAVAVGGTLTYTLTGTVPLATSGAVVNTATVTPPAGTEDPECTPSCTATAEDPTGPINLAVSKSAQPNPYVPGQPLTYTVTVTNAGPGSASSVAVSDPLPAGLEGAGFTWTCKASAGSGCTASGTGSINDPEVNIAAGGTLTYTVTGVVPASTSGTLMNTATVTPPAGSQDPGCTPSCSASAEDQNVPEAAVGIAKSASPATAVPGTNETYTLVVTNHGPDAASGVVVSDPVPAGETFVSASPGCSFASGVVTCQLASLANGASASFNVVTHLESSVTTAITNTATVSITDPPPPGCGCDPYPKEASVTLPVKPEVDVAITKHASTNVVPQGGQVMYTLIVQNNGPSDGTGVTVADKPPAGLTYVSAQAGQGSCTTAGKLACTLGTMPAGSSTQILVTAEVGAHALGSLKNTASVTVDQPDTNPANNSSSQTVTIKPPPQPVVDVAITKAVSSPTVIPGGQLLYTLVVRNNGPDEATGLSVSDTSPAGLTLTSALPAQGSCTIHVYLSCSLGNLKAGGQTQILVAATAVSNARGALKNIATVTSREKDSNPANNLATQTVTVPPPPYTPQAVSDLQISKRVTPSSARPGARLTYTLQVSNLGPAPATNAHVTDTPSLPLKVLSIRASQGSCQAGPPISCALGTLTAGQHVTITVTATVQTVGTEINTATATSASADPALAGNLAFASIKVTAALRLRKTVVSGTVGAGRDVSYRITVSNASASTIQGVTVCDTIPEQLVYASSAPRAHASDGRECWSIARLRAGSSRTFTITALAPPGSHGRVVNHATATARGIATARASAGVRITGTGNPCAGASRAGIAPRSGGAHRQSSATIAC